MSFVTPGEPLRKCRRTLNKIHQDREKLPLRELLFYNPPETVFQKEYRELHEEEQNKTSVVSPKLPSIKSRTSSRSSSVSSEQNGDKDNLSDQVHQQPVEVIESLEKEEIISSSSSVQSEKIDIAANTDGMLTIDEKGNIVVKKSDSQTDSQNDNQQAPKLKSSTTYNSFRRQERPRIFWSAEETTSFYAALEIVGTDFSLMKAVFFKDSIRDRKQLKQKFKREEKNNREYVDKILFESLKNRSKLNSIINVENVENTIPAAKNDNDNDEITLSDAETEIVEVTVNEI